MDCAHSWNDCNDQLWGGCSWVSLQHLQLPFQQCRDPWSHHRNQDHDCSHRLVCKIDCKQNWLFNNIITKKGASGCGTTYIRWGRTTCPNTTGAQLVYSGRAGGTYFNNQGGAADKICLPEDPDYLTASPDSAQASQIWGAEYEFDSLRSDIRNYNVPCAVCHVSSRSSVLMIPAKTQCPSSWTREYFGYLTAERDTYHRSSFECVDNSPEVIPGSSSHLNGALFYYTEATCNGLDCPPYQRNRILSCTVCTK